MVSCPVSVCNTSDKAAHYRATLIGEGISGDDQLDVQGHATETYYIIFQPGKVGKQQGRWVAIYLIYMYAHWHSCSDGGKYRIVVHKSHTCLEATFEYKPQFLQTQGAYKPHSNRSRGLKIATHPT